jgi:hypothetical protein
MLIVDLATLVMEVRDLYPTALQVLSPALRMMLTTPLPSNVATELTIMQDNNQCLEEKHFKTTAALIISEFV